MGTAGEQPCTGRGSLLTCGDVHPNPGPNDEGRSGGNAMLRVVSVNVTSLQANWGVLLAISADTHVVAVQETKCTADSQRRTGEELRTAGWHVVWGKPLQPWRSKFEAKAGGVRFWCGSAFR